MAILSKEDFKLALKDPFLVRQRQINEFIEAINALANISCMSRSARHFDRCSYFSFLYGTGHLPQWYKNTINTLLYKIVTTAKSIKIECTSMEPTFKPDRDSEQLVSVYVYFDK